MIARIWHGRTPQEKADAYEEYIRQTGLEGLRSVAGNRGVYILRRIQNGVAEIMMLSLWDSMDAIRDFAGPELEKAVYYPEDKDFLLELEPKVVHYEVAEAPELQGG